MSLPTPHGDKLYALLKNDKLPTCDRERIKQAIARYQVPFMSKGTTTALRFPTLAASRTVSAWTTCW
jgi:hypothetical protein